MSHPTTTAHFNTYPVRRAFTNRSQNTAKSQLLYRAQRTLWDFGSMQNYVNARLTRTYAPHLDGVKYSLI